MTIFTTAVAIFNTAVAIFTTAVGIFTTAVTIFTTAVTIFTTVVTIVFTTAVTIFTTVVTIRARPLIAYQLRKYFLIQPSPEWIFLSTLDTTYQITLGLPVPGPIFSMRCRAA
jgi:hypothetical protein